MFQTNDDFKGQQPFRQANLHTCFSKYLNNLKKERDELAQRNICFLKEIS